MGLRQSAGPCRTAACLRGTSRSRKRWGPGPDAQLLRAEQNEDVRNALGRVRKRMGELAWDILSDRLTQDDPRTLEDLGKQWGLSRERVRQVEKSTRNFLSRYLSDFDSPAYVAARE